MDPGPYFKMHRPIHAFYDPQPLVQAIPVSSTTLASASTTLSKPTVTQQSQPQQSQSQQSQPQQSQPQHPHPSPKNNVKQNSTPTPTPTPLTTNIINPASIKPIQSTPPVIIFPTSSTVPFVTKPYNGTNNNNYLNKHHHDKGFPWLAITFGILGILGMICISMCCFFLIYKRRKLRQQKQVRHESWASVSTIQTSMLDEKKGYIENKIEEPSLVMLRNQYAPQLAFSPSLIAGEFHQQQREDAPPLPSLSRSNTLIDNSDHHYRPKIEIYDPRVNLQ